MVESGKANNAIIAHLVLGDNGQLRQHLLMDHLKSTANKASEFAAFFGGAAIHAYCAQTAAPFGNGKCKAALIFCFHLIYPQQHPVRKV